MNKKLLILDGNSIMNRVFYGVRPLQTRQGLPTNAVFGYVNILLKHLEAQKPDYAAVAFDLKAPTFRHRAFDGYKATRKAMPEELVRQVPYVRAITDALGLRCLTAEGYEADDILGTVSRRFADRGDLCTIVTGDRDAFQLSDDRVTVVYTTVQADEVYTPKEIMEKYGVPPRQLIDVKALMGDSSDNIPGVAGIGEKTALRLISEYGFLDAVYEHLENGTLAVSESVREKLRAGKEAARQSRFLAEICREVPGLPPEEELLFQGYRAEPLRELLVSLEFTRLLSRIPSVSPSAQEPAAPSPQGSAEPGGQMDIFSDSASPAPSALPAGVLSEEEPNFCEADGDSLIVSNGAGLFRVPLSPVPFGEKTKLVLWDSKEFYHQMIRAGIDAALVKRCVRFDLLLAAYLDSPEGKTDFPKASMSYLSRPVPLAKEKDIPYKVSIMKEIYDILFDRIERDFKELYHNIELELSYVLAEMEEYGFKVSREGLQTYGEGIKARMAQIEEEIYRLAGQAFNLNSPKQLGEVLFEKLRLPVVKKKKTGYSTDAETLEKLRFHSPVIPAILEYRQLSKLYGTYVEGLLKQISGDGRIHTSFQQRQTQTGRLSSTEPNLQNIPVRTELGRELRKFFIPENDGYLLIDADYSQIELRIMAHISGDEQMIEAFRSGQDIHTMTASQVFGTPPDQVTYEERKRAKAVNFGIIYGIGEFSLSQDIGVTVREAKEYINGYFQTYPKVREYMKNIVAQARRTGYVSTLFGRRRTVFELSNPNKQIQAFGERVAMNTPIQGTAADIIKLAMVNTVRRLKREGMRSRLILQVHDELILEAPLEEAEYAKALLVEEMENAVSLRVRLSADAGMGKSWYDAKA